MAAKAKTTASKSRLPDKSKKPSSAGVTKLDAMVAALRAPKGATISALMKVTGWQQHSVRGALAGALKKKRGLKITSVRGDGERVYRIETGK